MVPADLGLQARDDAKLARGEVRRTRRTRRPSAARFREGSLEYVRTPRSGIRPWGGPAGSLEFTCALRAPVFALGTARRAHARRERKACRAQAGGRQTRELYNSLSRGPAATETRVWNAKRMEYDVVIVGGGPAGLAAAIRIKQRAAEAGREVSVVVLEKGSELGAHILSGAVMDPRALTELIPDWKERKAPLDTPVSEDRFYLLTRSKAIYNPHWLAARLFAQRRLLHRQPRATSCRWLGQQAEALGVEIFAGFAGAEVLYDDGGAVRGVATGDMGVGKDGQPTANYQPGVELAGKYTLFAEGARGHLGKQVIARYSRDEGRDPQTCGHRHQGAVGGRLRRNTSRGSCCTAQGWPLDRATYGGGFMYHFENRQVSVGLVVGLGYANPYLEPFQEFQRYKTHPTHRGIPRRRQAHRLRRARDQRERTAVAAEARLPGRRARRLRRRFPERAADQGLARRDQVRNAGRRRRVRRACRRTGARRARRIPDCVRGVMAPRRALRRTELQAVPRLGTPRAARSCGASTNSSCAARRRGRCTGNWRTTRSSGLPPSARPSTTRSPTACSRSTSSRRSSFRTRTTRRTSPRTCTLKDASVPVAINLARYDGPEARYCPAGVYEFVESDEGAERLQINAQNCVHCKTCDIKDPTQNIVWVAARGRRGPALPEHVAATGARRCVGTALPRAPAHG